MVARRKPAIRRSDPRCYRKINSAFEADRMTGTTEHATIVGKVLLMQNNGTLEGAVGITRSRQAKTIDVQHWTNLLYTIDWVPRKWIIPVEECRVGYAKLGKPYVETIDPFDDIIQVNPTLTKRTKKQMSVLLEVIKKELEKMQIPKVPLSSAIKGQVAKNISVTYFEKAKQIGQDIYFSKIDFELPWKVR
ncbi:hypothetical protein KY333_06025 [Candidatus Woesearchaeota archaeon]|nr:hypothetical protein [Candidatus Woesearchaeota archaeon]MBW2994321.1 hypothetical protein [Candidatus Woesearchaeota archaeon]